MEDNENSRRPPDPGKSGKATGQDYLDEQESDGVSTKISVIPQKKSHNINYSCSYEILCPFLLNFRACCPISNILGRLNSPP